MKLLGIDLGIGKLGVCSIEKIGSKKSITSFIMTSVKKKGVDNIPEFINTNFILDDKFRKLLAWQDFVVIEMPFNTQGFGKSQIEVLGVIKFLCVLYDVKHVMVAQTTVKKFATGSGKAQKSDMVMKAYKEYKFEAETEDEVDAFWLAMFGLAIKSDEDLSGKKWSSQRKESVNKIKEKSK